MRSYKNSLAYRYVSLTRLFPKGLAGFLCVLGLSVAALSLVIDYFGNGILSGVFELSYALFLATGVYYLFLQRLEDEADKSDMSVDGARILHSAVRAGEIDNLALFKSLINLHSTEWVLKHLGVEERGLIKKAASVSGTLHLQNLLESSEQFNAAAAMKYLISYSKPLSDYFYDRQIGSDDLVEVFNWHRSIKTRAANKNKFWLSQNLLNIKGIGKDWSAGWLRSLEYVSRDLTAEAMFKKSPEHLFSHGPRVEQIARALVEGNRNAILVGQTGVGKHAILRALAQSMNNGRTYGPIRYQRLIQIDPSAILTKSSSNDSPLERISELLGEAIMAGNVILVIDNIDALFDSNSQSVSRVDATEAIMPFLKSRLRIIGITSEANYQSTIGRNQEVERYFAKISIEPSSNEDTLHILEEEASILEGRTGIVFTLQSLKEIIALGNRLIQNLPQPEKSLGLLNEVTTYVLTHKDYLEVGVDDVQEVLSEKTHVPLGTIGDKEKELLLNLEEILHHRIIGQDLAIKEISDALRRSRAAVSDTSRPIGSFLFLGPTGVGKTETTKALAAIYFGSEDRIVRFDMSEFQEIHSIDRLIGNKDQEEGGLLTEALIASPFCIILLDEIEKAHPKIMDLFLQVLDEGRLTDALGRTVSFDNAMIIATSNAGSELIMENLSSGLKNDSSHLIEYVVQKHTFRPEFLNRFDGVIIFEPLDKQQLRQVASLAIQYLNKRLAGKSIEIRASDEILDMIVSKAYKPEFGARPLRRFVQDTIENFVAKGLLSNKIKRGDVVEVTAEMLDK